MKKIFSLAIALIATIGIANAQDYPYVMHVNKANGDVAEYYVSQVEDVTFEQTPWDLYADGIYTYQILYSGYDYLSMYQNLDKTSEYHINDWIVEGYPLEFTLNDDNTLTVPEDQDTGYAYSYTSSGITYGPTVLCAESADFCSWFSSSSGMDANGYASYYDPETDTYYFALAYYLFDVDNIGYCLYFGYTGYATTSSSGGGPGGSGGPGGGQTTTTYTDYETFEVTEGYKSAQGKKNAPVNENGEVNGKVRMLNTVMFDEPKVLKLTNRK